MDMNVERQERENNRLADQLVSALNECQVRYCHWKSNEHLQAGLEGKTDLDILVDRADCGSFTKVLTDLRFRRVISQPETTYIAVENWIGFCEETGILLHLHVHFELVTGLEFVKEYAFPWSRHVLDTAVIDPESGFPVTDPNVEVILLILRLSVKGRLSSLIASALVKRRPYSEPMQKELAYLQERLTVERLDEALEEMFDEASGLKTTLKKLAEKKELEGKDLLRVRWGIHKELGGARRYGGVTALERSFLGGVKLKKNLILERLGVRVMRKKRFETGGTVIALIGKEGSERCDVLRNLEKWLRWKMDVCIYPIAGGDMVRAQEGTRKMRQKGGIVLLEGSPDVPAILHKEDARKSGRRAPYGLRVVPDAREREHILERKLSAFQPDIIIRLTDAEERREDMKGRRAPGKETVEEKVIEYEEKLQEKRKVFDVDASRPFEEVVLEARRIIWQNL